MAKKLPFITEPKKETYKAGNPKIGELEFSVYGDLTVREQAFINEKLAKNSVFLQIARIANKVAKAQKIQPVGAHKFLTKCITTALTPEAAEGIDFTKNEENWKVLYAREIEELTQFLLATQWERQLVTAAAVIRYRLEGMEDFDVEDCRDLPQQLIQSVYAFALIEQTAEHEDEEEDEEEQLEESLKK